jgi:ABC-type nitrate/sulfonate/bicarbonate transport system substrate-binding protein
MNTDRDLQRWRRRWAHPAWALGVVGVVMALQGAAWPARAATLTVALSNLPYYAPMWIADAEGYFAAEGLDLRLLHCVNGRRCLQHLTDGEAQLATVADVPIVFAAQAGLAFDIIATFSASSRNHRLVVRTDRGIRSAADLKGKRIGFPRGTSAHYFVDSFLAYHGIPGSQVTRVPLDVATVTAALVRGEVDAAGFYLPDGPRALALLGEQGQLLPNPRAYTATNNLVSQPGVSDADLTKVLRALRRAVGFIKAEPERARARISDWLKMGPGELQAMWGELEFRLVLDQSIISTLEAEGRWALRQNLVLAGPPPNFLERVRAGPLRAVDARAVSISQ